MKALNAWDLIGLSSDMELVSRADGSAVLPALRDYGFLWALDYQESEANAHAVRLDYITAKEKGRGSRHAPTAVSLLQPQTAVSFCCCRHVTSSSRPAACCRR